MDAGLAGVSLPAIAAMLGKFQPNHALSFGWRKKYRTSATSIPTSHLAGIRRRTLAIAWGSLLVRRAIVGRIVELGLRTGSRDGGMINQVVVLRNGVFPKLLGVHSQVGDRIARACVGNFEGPGSFATVLDVPRTLDG